MLEIDLIIRAPLSSDGVHSYRESCIVSELISAAHRLSTRKHARIIQKLVDLPFLCSPEVFDALHIISILCSVRQVPEPSSNTREQEAHLLELLFHRPVTRDEVLLDASSSFCSLQRLDSCFDASKLFDAELDLVTLLVEVCQALNGVCVSLRFEGVCADVFLGEPFGGESFNGGRLG